MHRRVRATSRNAWALQTWRNEQASRPFMYALGHGVSCTSWRLREHHLLGRERGNERCGKSTPENSQSFFAMLFVSNGIALACRLLSAPRVCCSMTAFPCCVRRF